MTNITKSRDKIRELLQRGVEEVIVKKELESRLLSGKKLRIKLGIDPTGSVLHLGHAVVLRKLKEFQDLGHQAIFLIGDFTAKIGDPTGRSAARIPMTDKEIKVNMKSYTKQAGLILDIQKVEIRYNSEWLDKLNFQELIMLASKITYAQMAQRADFKDRIKNDQDLSLQEFLYPMMQGYDSVELKADVEIGGTDQKFNLLMGRQLQKRYNQEPQEIITCPLLEGLSGGDKMSKSLNNYIALTESGEMMFGKIMSLPDDLILRYFELCTDVSMDEIGEIKRGLAQGVNPRDIKARLAAEIVKLYHGDKMARAAASEFDKVFRRHERPEKIEIRKKAKGKSKIDALLADLGLASSKSEARRLVEQGGVRIDDKVVRDWKQEVLVKKGMIVRVGKRKFVEIG